MNGSTASRVALEHALALAEDCGATVEVLHVIPRDNTLLGDERSDVEREIDAVVARARTVLGDRVSWRDTIGDPLREILAAARAADLIVIGTHGRVGRLHALLGSITEGIVRNAPCPVLTVRDTSGGYQSFAERRHGRRTVAEEANGTGHMHRR